MFVLGISAWYLIEEKGRVHLAKRSMLVAAIFGLLSSLMVAYTGDAFSQNNCTGFSLLNLPHWRLCTEGKAMQDLMLSEF